MTDPKIKALARKLTDDDWLIVEATGVRATDLALLAYVRDLAAGLVEPEREVLAGSGDWGPTASFACAGHFRGKGLHAWVTEGDGKRSSTTALGRAVLRVLESEDGR